MNLDLANGVLKSLERERLTDELMALVEAYRTAGGREEHAARKDHLRIAIEQLVDENHTLRTVNAVFGRRQEWWDRRMFEMEQVAQRDTALLRQCLVFLDELGENRWGNRVGLVGALRDRLK